MSFRFTRVALMASLAIATTGSRRAVGSQAPTGSGDSYQVLNVG